MVVFLFFKLSEKYLLLAFIFAYMQHFNGFIVFYGFAGKNIQFVVTLIYLSLSVFVSSLKLSLSDDHQQSSIRKNNNNAFLVSMKF